MMSMSRFRPRLQDIRCSLSLCSLFSPNHGLYQRHSLHCLRTVEWGTPSTTSLIGGHPRINATQRSFTGHFSAPHIKHFSSTVPVSSVKNRELRKVMARKSNPPKIDGPRKEKKLERWKVNGAKIKKQEWEKKPTIPDGDPHGDLSTAIFKTRRKAEHAAKKNQKSPKKKDEARKAEHATKKNKKSSKKKDPAALKSTTNDDHLMIHDPVLEQAIRGHSMFFPGLVRKDKGDTYQTGPVEMRRITLNRDLDPDVTTPIPTKRPSRIEVLKSKGPISSFSIEERKAYREERPGGMNLGNGMNVGNMDHRADLDEAHTSPPSETFQSSILRKVSWEKPLPSQRPPGLDHLNDPNNTPQIPRRNRDSTRIPTLNHSQTTQSVKPPRPNWKAPQVPEYFNAKYPVLDSKVTIRTSKSGKSVQEPIRRDPFWVGDDDEHGAEVARARRFYDYIPLPGDETPKRRPFPAEASKKIENDIDEIVETHGTLATPPVTPQVAKENNVEALPIIAPTTEQSPSSPETTAGIIEPAKSSEIDVGDIQVSDQEIHVTLATSPATPQRAEENSIKARPILAANSTTEQSLSSPETTADVTEPAKSSENNIGDIQVSDDQAEEPLLRGAGAPPSYQFPRYLRPRLRTAFRTARSTVEQVDAIRRARLPVVATYLRLAELEKGRTLVDSMPSLETLSALETEETFQETEEAFQPPTTQQPGLNQEPAVSGLADNPDLTSAIGSAKGIIESAAIAEFEKLQAQGNPENLTLNDVRWRIIFSLGGTPPVPVKAAEYEQELAATTRPRPKYKDPMLLKAARSSDPLYRPGEFAEKGLDSLDQDTRRVLSRMPKNQRTKKLKKALSPIEEYDPSRYAATEELMEDHPDLMNSLRSQMVLDTAEKEPERLKGVAERRQLKRDIRAEILKSRMEKDEDAYWSPRQQTVETREPASNVVIRYYPATNPDAGLLPKEETLDRTEVETEEEPQSYEFRIPDPDIQDFWTPYLTKRLDLPKPGLPKPKLPEPVEPHPIADQGLPAPDLSNISKTYAVYHTANRKKIDLPDSSKVSLEDPDPTEKKMEWAEPGQGYRRLKAFPVSEIIKEKAALKLARSEARKANRKRKRDQTKENRARRMEKHKDDVQKILAEQPDLTPRQALTDIFIEERDKKLARKRRKKAKMLGIPVEAMPPTRAERRRLQSLEVEERRREKARQKELLSKARSKRPADDTFDPRVPSVMAEREAPRREMADSKRLNHRGGEDVRVGRLEPLDLRQQLSQKDPPNDPAAIQRERSFHHQPTLEGLEPHVASGLQLPTPQPLEISDLPTPDLKSFNISDPTAVANLQRRLRFLENTFENKYRSPPREPVKIDPEWDPETVARMTVRAYNVKVWEVQKIAFSNQRGSRTAQGAIKEDQLRPIMRKNITSDKNDPQWGRSRDTAPSSGFTRARKLEQSQSEERDRKQKRKKERQDSRKTRMQYRAAKKAMRAEKSTSLPRVSPWKPRIQGQNNARQLREPDEAPRKTLRWPNNEESG